MVEQKNDQTVTIKIGPKTFECPLISGSENEQALDISSLRTETGAITLDPAYMNTAACESKVTFLDGEKGILRYRGYPIESLAERASYLEVAYLLFYGELASNEARKKFEKDIAKHSKITKKSKDYVQIQGFLGTPCGAPCGAPCMGWTSHQSMGCLQHQGGLV